MKFLRYALFVFCGCQMLSSCDLLPTNVNGNNPIARVNESYLYASDLSGIVPSGINEKDSGLLVRNYIENWARQQLLLNKANINLSFNEIQAKLDQQIEDYRVSLIIHAYKQELIRQQLDTIVTQSQIAQYYDLHKDKLRLGAPAVMVNYIKVSNDIKGLEKLKKLLKSNDKDDSEELIDFCQKHAFEFLLDDNAWVGLENFLLLVPLDLDKHEDIAHYKNVFEKRDSLYTYIVHLKEYRIAGDVAPLVLEKLNIGNAILNVRKRELLKNLEGSILKDAISIGEFEVYEQQ